MSGKVIKRHEMSYKIMKSHKNSWKVIQDSMTAKWSMRKIVVFSQLWNLSQLWNEFLTKEMIFIVKKLFSYWRNYFLTEEIPQFSKGPLRMMMMMMMMKVYVGPIKIYIQYLFIIYWIRKYTYVHYTITNR